MTGMELMLPPASASQTVQLCHAACILVTLAVMVVCHTRIAMAVLARALPPPVRIWSLEDPATTPATARYRVHLPLLATIIAAVVHVKRGAIAVRTSVHDLDPPGKFWGPPDHATTPATARYWLLLLQCSADVVLLLHLLQLRQFSTHITDHCVALRLLLRLLPLEHLILTHQNIQLLHVAGFAAEVDVPLPANGVLLTKVGTVKLLSGSVTTLVAVDGETTVTARSSMFRFLKSVLVKYNWHLRQI